MAHIVGDGFAYYTMLCGLSSVKEGSSDAPPKMIADCNQAYPDKIPGFLGKEQSA
jgi:hypothetical protein